MTERQQSILDKVKAAAFPLLVGLIGFFLIKFYNQQDTMIDKVQEIKSEVIKINGVTNVQEYRLNDLGQRIGRIENRQDYFETYDPLKKK